MNSYPLVTVPFILTGYMLPIKIIFRLKIIYSRLILHFFCFLALIIHELGLGDNAKRELRINLSQIKLNLQHRY